MSDVLERVHAPAVERLTRDMMRAAEMLSKQECRYLVDAYYIMQEDRKRADNQILHMEGEPNLIISWLAAQASTLEQQVKRVLDKFTSGHQVGIWCKSNYGIGPVISAGLIAHLSMEVHRCVRHLDNPKIKPCKHFEPHEGCGPTRTEVVGRFYRFAGLDPTVKWEKGKRRPWNAALRTLCWHAGQDFMKFHKHENCFYGHIYKDRKRYEQYRNYISCENQDTARRQLAERNYGKTTDAYKHLTGVARVTKQELDRNVLPDGVTEFPAVPHLPPGQIDARARRYAVKMFLSSLHLIWYWNEFGTLPPKPWTPGVENHKFPRNNPHYVGFNRFMVPPNIEHAAPNWQQFAAALDKANGPAPT